VNWLIVLQFFIAPSAETYDDLPPMLRPQSKQYTIPHMAGIDICHFPAFENFLLSNGTITRTSYCRNRAATGHIATRPVLSIPRSPENLSKCPMLSSSMFEHSKIIPSTHPSLKECLRCCFEPAFITQHDRDALTG